MRVFDKAVADAKVRDSLEEIRKLQKFPGVNILVHEPVILREKSYFLRVEVYQVANTAGDELGGFD